MNRRLFIGLLAVLGIAVTIFNPLISGIFAVGVWIYLVRMVRKQMDSVFKGQTEQRIFNRHLKRVKALLTVGACSFVVFAVGSIVHNVLHGLSEMEESVSFFVALVALLVFIVASVGGLVIFLKGRERWSQNGHNAA